MSDVHVPQNVDRDIRKRFSEQDVKAYQHAVEKLRQSTLQSRQRLLTGVSSNRFKKAGARWTMRASKKHRLLLDMEQGKFVVRGMVSRGDHHFYPKE